MEFGTPCLVSSLVHHMLDFVAKTCVSCSVNSLRCSTRPALLEKRASVASSGLRRAAQKPAHCDSFSTATASHFLFEHRNAWFGADVLAALPCPAGFGPPAKNSARRVVWTASAALSISISI